MPYDVVPPYVETVIPFFRDTGRYTVPRTGTGRLAGEFPDGITTVEGVPVSAEVRVLLRTPTGQVGDGAFVARTISAANGTWQITGLPTNLRYDVVGRLNGQNDVIMANIAPDV